MADFMAAGPWVGALDRSSSHRFAGAYSAVAGVVGGPVFMG
jgi:hypothetical protein